MIHYLRADPRHQHEKRYRYCVRCGEAYSQYEIDFVNGSVAPVVGETLTGAETGTTAVVSEIKLDSGSWAGGDARGTIIVTNVT